ncbi:MAG: heavy metal-binding domain-containing protein [Myxococcota bacterium]
MIELIIQLVLPLALLAVAYISGRLIERSHYRSIRSREAELRNMPAVTFKQVPKGWDVERSDLVTGSVVVSVDHFKRFLAGLRMVFGGRVKSYESLLDRARREALLRCKEHAQSRGFQAIVNVRLETTRMASSRRQGKATAGVEVLAFGTGLRLRREPA